MIDDGSEELFEGFWPIIRRVVIVLLPIWVYLLCWSAGLHLIVSSILSGISVSLVIIFEKLRLKHQSESK